MAGPERHHLAKQVQTFRIHANKLKKIFKDTVTVLSDLQEFDESLSIDKILAVDAQKCISNVVSGRTALVVFGDTRSRFAIVNEILGEPVVPPPRVASEQWRMIHFKYRKTRTMALLIDGFDAPLERTSTMSRIPREGVCVDTEKGQKAVNATLEVGLGNPILEAGFEIICAPTSVEGRLDAIKCALQVCQVELHPFFIYGHDGQSPMTQQQISELTQIRQQMPDVPLLFAFVTTATDQNGRRGSADTGASASSYTPTINLIQEQLCQLGYCKDSDYTTSTCSIGPHDNPETNPDPYFQFMPVDTIVVNFTDFISELLTFVQCNMRQQITSAASSLHDAHARCLQTLILYAHDLARDVLVTPLKIKYAKSKEEELYTQLVELASRKQSEIKELVAQAIAEATDAIIKEVLQMEFEGVSLDSSMQAGDSKGTKKCITQIQELVFRELSKRISERLVGSVNYLRESVIGTLKRCLENLEGSVHMVVPVDDTGESSRALSQIIDAAYTLEFSERTSTSAVRLLVERLKQAFQGPSLKSLRLDSQWKEKYVNQLIDSISAGRLAKSICSQFRTKVGASHEAFLSAMKQLEMRISGRLKETEGQRSTIRKVLTPRMARLSLSSVALRDVIIHGLPVTGRELGRGQYGVVFQCAEWAGKGPLAVKSVVPPDDKHWNDLALEFHYTWTLPKNDRVVNLVGALIDDDYSNGANAVVLFIMPRYPRDLHGALKAGLDFGARMQIALDVMEGIRFLHSQGLLHRDIKLKNVLLDANNRGTLTDLGFCKPEAMMTCTIVGTPIHMAPELFGGAYDSSVDIYAFGILFWYICANHVKLPQAFDACQNKEQLWTAVRKGLRPERLPCFEQPEWELMSACWHGEVHMRPAVGDVVQNLTTIMKRVGRKPLPP
ncbi:hypothetical protein EMCRGX_G026941 [Ephydatia muelleri]